MSRVTDSTSKEESSFDSSEDIEDDGCFSDWASSLGLAKITKSLFDDKTFPCPEDALTHDEKIHQFSLRHTAHIYSLDVYDRMRLINWIRKTVRMAFR